MATKPTSSSTWTTRTNYSSSAAASTGFRNIPTTADARLHRRPSPQKERARESSPGPTRLTEKALPGPSPAVLPILHRSQHLRRRLDRPAVASPQRILPGIGLRCLAPHRPQEVSARVERQRIGRLHLVVHAAFEHRPSVQARFL